MKKDFLTQILWKICIKKLKSIRKAWNFLEFLLKFQSLNCWEIKKNWKLKIYEFLHMTNFNYDSFGIENYFWIQNLRILTKNIFLKYEKSNKSKTELEILRFAVQNLRKKCDTNFILRSKK